MPANENDEMTKSRSRSTSIDVYLDIKLASLWQQAIIYFVDKNDYTAGLDVLTIRNMVFY